MNRDKLVGIVKAIPVAHRVVIGVAVVILVLATKLFLGWANQPSYTVLSSGLDDKELAEVINELETQGVPYKIEGGGSRILVPQKDLATTRAGLAEAGVGGGVEPEGYEILKDQGLSMSDAMQQVNFRRALEGELQKALQAMDGIDSAKVQLVVPDESLFTEDQAPATAAVLLDTRSELTDGQVEAVTYMVSSSVEGLTPEHITITDTEGRVLSAPGSASGIAGGGKNLELTQQFEALLTADVQRLLQAYDAEVVVKADLNFDQTHTESETYDPETQGTIVLREDRTSEAYTGDGTPPNGIVGVDGGTTDDAAVGADGVTNYTMEQQTVENGVSRVVSTSEQAPGKVEGLHVAIVLDSGVNTGASAPNPEQVRSLVTAALGLQIAGETPRDSIEVQTFDLPATTVATNPDGTPIDEAVAADEAEEKGPLAMLPQALGALVLAFVAFSLWRMTRKPKARKAKKVKGEKGGAIEGAPALGAGGINEAFELGAGGFLELGSAAPVDPALLAQHTAMDNLRDDVIDLVQRQPEEIAVLLRGWLADRRAEAR
jgi:flagellar M-ring protein FliF